MEISHANVMIHSRDQQRRVRASTESDQQRNPRGSTSGVTFDNRSGQPRSVDRSGPEPAFDPLAEDRRLQGRLVTDARNQPISQAADNQRRSESTQQKVQQAYRQTVSADNSRREDNPPTSANEARQAAFQDNAIDLVV